MTSADITFPRAKSSQVKFDLMADMAEGYESMGSDAENLLFANDPLTLFVPMVSYITRRIQKKLSKTSTGC
jgi:hypothetical protein